MDLHDVKGQEFETLRTNVKKMARRNSDSSHVSRIGTIQTAIPTFPRITRTILFWDNTLEFGVQDGSS